MANALSVPLRFRVQAWILLGPMHAIARFVIAVIGFAIRIVPLRPWLFRQQWPKDALEWASATIHDAFRRAGF